MALSLLTAYAPSIDTRDCLKILLEGMDALEGQENDEELLEIVDRHAELIVMLGL